MLNGILYHTYIKRIKNFDKKLITLIRHVYQKQNKNGGRDQWQKINESCGHKN